MQGDSGTKEGLKELFLDKQLFQAVHRPVHVKVYVVLKATTSLQARDSALKKTKRSVLRNAAPLWQDGLAATDPRPEDGGDWKQRAGDVVLSWG